MKKNLLIFTIFCVFAVLSRTVYSQRLPQRASLDPVQVMIQAALQSKPELLAKHPHVKLYFSKFLVLWRAFFNRLQKDEKKSTGLEDQFNLYYHTVGNTRKEFKPLSPTSSFSYFNKDILKGMRKLENWCLDMRDRIKYATTAYQRKMYMTRLYRFQRDWYQKFFGAAVQELNADWSSFSTNYWRDILTKAELLKLQKNKDAYQYLTRYYSIRFQYLKKAASIARKIRKNEGSQGDPKKMVGDIKQELGNVKNALTNLKKLHSPKLFQSFQNLELKRLTDLEQDTSFLVQIEEGMHHHVSRSKIEHLIVEKNKVDSKMGKQLVKIHHLYENAMKIVLGEKPKSVN